MKQGVLEMETTIHTPMMDFNVPEGTEVTVKRGVLEFEGTPFKGVKVNGEYKLIVGGEEHKVEFPDGGDTPFPWLLLDF